MNLSLPQKIKQLISGKNFNSDDIGKSNAKVLMFDDCVLKIEPRSASNEKSIEVLRWLQGKLPVPKILAYEIDQAAGLQYFLMSKVPGTIYPRNVKEATGYLTS